MLESLVVNILNQFLKDYVSNLNYDQLKIGIWNGEVNLSNLKLRKEALDKLDLPVSVSEGYIDQIKLVIPWSNLKGEPVKVLIEHIYLLAEPRNEKTYSAQEEEERQFYLKQQRLAEAEVLDSAKQPGDDKNNDGFMAQLTTKVINNLQFQIQNIHIRYEDKISDPNHPFAVGITLNELSGLSTDDQWQPNFISDPSSPINKLVTLESLSLYWDTDADSLAGKREYDSSVFTTMIPTRTHSPDHKYLLKPVSGTARITLNPSSDKPKTDATLLFDELAFVLDENQYRDCILMLDLFQANIKKQKYLKFHPGPNKSAKKNPREYFRFAAEAVRSEIHEKHYKWSWDHFRTRRDQRLSYVECYMASKLNTATEKQVRDLEALERVLSFQDIRFYRNIANVNLRKQKVQIEIETQRKKAENSKKSWWEWATGASKSSEEEDEPIQMTEEQKKELYEAIEYDEDKINVSAASTLPKDSIKLAAKTTLKKGSFTLKKDKEQLLSLVFDTMSANFTQYVESVKVGASLGDIQLFDGSPNTMYPQLIGVKTEDEGSLLDYKYNQDFKQRMSLATGQKDPFFSVVFEKNPLDNTASNALVLNTRPLEIIYSPTLIASVAKFFKPPSSKMEGVNAVINAAESRLEQLKTHSRASLEFAFEKHTTFDVNISIDAPIIYIPESLTKQDSSVLMIKPGHIKVDSELADSTMVDEIKTKGIQNYNEQDVKNLERLMYDKFNVKLTQTKIVLGASVQEFLQKDVVANVTNSRLIDNMDMHFSIELCILPENTQFAKAKVSGYLPLLAINVSDEKYKMLMQIVDAATPKSEDESTKDQQSVIVQSSQSQHEIVLPDSDSEISIVQDKISDLEQFKFDFRVDKVSILLCETTITESSKKDEVLSEILLEGFTLAVVGKAMDLSVDLTLQSLNIEDKMEHGKEFNYLLTSTDNSNDADVLENKDLLKIKFQKTSKDHPKFSSVYDEYDQSVDLSLSTFKVIVTRSSLLHLQNWASKTFESSAKPSEPAQEEERDNVQIKQSKARTKVVLHMDSAHVMLNNDGSKLATLGLHSGDLALSLEPKTLDVTGKFGNLTLSDDAAGPNATEKFIVSIVGDELADFSFKTFDPNSNPEYDQAFKLRMGAIKCVASTTLQPIMEFMTQFLEMKSIYDNAKNTARETAQNYQQGNSRFHFDVLINSPLVVLPAGDQETVTAYLGEIRAKNAFSDNMVLIECGLYKINVQSTTAEEKLSIMKDLDIVVNIDNLEKPNGKEPNTKVRGSISDVLVSLSEKQYKSLLKVSENLQKTFVSSEPKPRIENSESSVTALESSPVQAGLVKLDLSLELSVVCLELFKNSNESLSKLVFHSMAVKMQSMSDESSYLEAQLQSIEFSDTRSESKSKFREILPAQSLNGPQFEFKLRSSKELKDMQVKLDSPKIILSLDYMLLLKDFFTAPLAVSESKQVAVQSSDLPPVEKNTPKITLKYNVCIDQFEVICLASPEMESSEAVVLSFNQFKADQQDDIANLDLKGIDMSLCRMNNRDKSTVHVIKPLDVVLLVNQIEGMTVNLQVKPILLRLSYQDVMLITSIVDRALALKPTAPEKKKSDRSQKLEVSKESLIASFEGLQIILIEDMHEVPFIDFYIEPFEMVASDWSKPTIDAQVEFCLGVKNFNFKNSHWEPLLEPWRFGIKAAQDPKDKCTHISLNSEEYIYLNLTHTFIESALVISQTMSEIKSLADSANVQVKPYEIVNTTGYSINFWNMSDDVSRENTHAYTLANGQSMAWNFRDTRTTAVKRNLLGVQIEQDGWEMISHIDVDRERELTYRLDNSHNLIIDIHLENHVKKVFLRSGLVFENGSSQDIELRLADSVIHHLKPKETCTIPIKLCYQPLVVRPSDQFEWSRQLLWSDFSRPQTIDCPHSSGISESHLFQAEASSIKANNYPHLKVKFIAPLEIENLLPFDFEIDLLEPSTNKRHTLSLTKGTKTHVHEFSSNAVLNLQLALKSGKYKSSDVTTIKTRPGYNELGEKIMIRDQNGTPVNLRMHVTRTANASGSLYLGIYAPYLILNKSSFPIHLRSKETFRQAPVESIPAYKQGSVILPAIFSFADMSTRNRAQISIDGAKWSEPVSFEAVGNSQGATLSSKTDSFVKHVGIKVEEGNDALRLTKIVTITPRYVLKNLMPLPLELREFGTEGVVSIQPGAKMAFYNTSASQVRWVSLRYQNHPWSAPVNIQDIGKMYVKLDSENLVRVTVSVNDATLFATFGQDAEWPYQIVNDSSVDIQCAQSNIDFDNSQVKGSQKKELTKPSDFTIASGQTLNYSWDVPVAKEKKLELCVGGKRREINFEAVGSQVPFCFAKNEPNGTISMDVVAKGSALVLHITDFDASKSLYRPKSSEESFEAVNVNHVINSVFQVNLAGLRLSVIDRNAQELALATVKRFEFKHTDSSLYQSIRLSVEWIQIDNQSFGSTYPILFYPSARPKVSNEKTTHPTLHVALDKVKDTQHGVQYFKIFSFLAQEITLEVDESFLYALMDFTQFNGVSSTKNSRNDVYLMDIEEPAVENESALYYFEEFCIQPMRLNISFGKNDSSTNNTAQNILQKSPIGYVINVLTMTIGNINDAPIKLNALMVDNLRASSNDLSLRIALHYREQAMYQVHRVLGSIDILGNPVGLFNNLSSGFGELFYEPYQGFIMSDRPQDLGIGVAKGVGGFMKKSVFGVTDSLSRLTGSLGKGLSAATMDKKFQDKRRTNMNRNKPTHAVGGVTQGVGYFGASLASGITGLVTNPLEGASEKGAMGFVGGIGKGLVGVITKPAAGLFDMTSNITAGIRETASADGKVILRERLPRFIGKDGILIPYSQREALGQLWLKEADDGRFFRDSYVAHGLLKGGKEALILTHSSVIVMRSDNLKVSLHIPLQSIASVDAREDRISLTAAKNKTNTLIFDQDTNGDWFAKKVVETLQSRQEDHQA